MIDHARREKQMQKRSVLLIEDDHKVRTSQYQTLENWGLHVMTAHDGIDATRKNKTNNLDLIIAQYEMPGLAGLEFLKRVKSDNKDVEVLFVSKEASVDHAVEAMKAGAFDFMIKPVDQTQLRLSIDRAFYKNGDKEYQGNKKGRYVNIVSQDKNVLSLIDLAKQVADSSASVFIHGESGTGKELFARYIHQNSKRRNGPFIAINCAALPESLLESEMFGHEKGAFTGAVSKKPGKFEIADGGTLLLDEITEMALHLQSKLLRVLQEREVDRVGGLRPVSVDVRVIATSNRDISKAIEKEQLREDLFYRLNIIPIRIPPLRERYSDIDLLAQYFIEKYNEIDNCNVKSLTREALESLNALPLKGNVRELENIIHRAVLLSDGTTIKKEDLLLDETISGGHGTSGDGSQEEKGFPKDLVPEPLREVEKKMIFHTLDKTKGNRTHAAKMLGISVRTLRNKINEYKEKMEMM